MTSAWPDLPYDDWKPTKETLHRYMQVVGKVRMALVPPRNHWWHVTLYPVVGGISTGPMPARDRDVEIVLDPMASQLKIATSDGDGSFFDLSPSLACADFYESLLSRLDHLGVDVAIDDRAFDLGDSPRLSADRENTTFDLVAVERYWRILGATRRVLDRFAGEFAGKASPTHLFWHTFDLAHARYSGRRAPIAEGADPITAEAYSHEVIAFGFWPGDARQTPFPAFYSYTAPEPSGLTDRPLASGARWSTSGGGHLALLPYDDVRTQPDPDACLLDFFRSAYAAGSAAAGWDVDDLRRG